MSGRFAKLFQKIGGRLMCGRAPRGRAPKGLPRPAASAGLPSRSSPPPRSEPHSASSSTARFTSPSQQNKNRNNQQSDEDDEIRSIQSDQDENQSSDEKESTGRYGCCGCMRKFDSPSDVTTHSCKSKKRLKYMFIHGDCGNRFQNSADRDKHADMCDKFGYRVVDKIKSNLAHKIKMARKGNLWAKRPSPSDSPR